GPAEATFPGADGRIAFSYTDGTRGLVATMKPDGSDVRYLRAGGEPAWSADGHRLAFVSANGNQSEIYMMRADGSNVRRLTFTPDLNELSPTFSPNGKRIVAWTAEYPPASRHHHVVSMRSDGSHRRVLARRGLQPEWAPNGKHIVYVGRDGGIRIMRPDGTHKRRLYDSPAFDGFLPRYAPAGDSIVFGRCRLADACATTEWVEIRVSGGEVERLPISS